MSSTTFSEERQNLIATLYPENSNEVSAFLARMVNSPEDIVQWLLKKSQEDTKFASSLVSIIKYDTTSSKHDAANSISSNYVKPGDKSKYTCTISDPMPFMNTSPFKPNENIQRGFECKNTSEIPFSAGFYVLDECGVIVFMHKKEVPPNESLCINIPIIAPITPGKYTRKFILFDNEGKAVGDPLVAVMNVVDGSSPNKSIVGKKSTVKSSRRMPKGTFSGILSSKKIPSSVMKMPPFEPQKDMPISYDGSQPQPQPQPQPQFPFPGPLAPNPINQIPNNPNMNQNPINNPFIQNNTGNYGYNQAPPQLPPSPSSSSPAQQQQQQQQQPPQLPPPPPYQNFNTQGPGIQYGAQPMGYNGYQQGYNGFQHNQMQFQPPQLQQQPQQFPQPSYPSTTGSYVYQRQN